MIDLIHPGAAVNVGVLSTMCSYNRINGIWACENPVTLNAELKGVWFVYDNKCALD